MDSTEISLCDAYASGRRDFLKAAVSFAVTLAASRLPSAWAADEPAMPAPRSRAHQVRITNLSDYPPGQEVPGCLRHAVLNAKPDTRITFAAPGTINLQRPLFIETDGLTIDGESAPVVIYGDTVGIRASDVIIRHLWIFAGDAPADEKRPGKGGHSKGNDRDALVLWGADARSGKAISAISIENCWIGFGIDECLSTYGDVSQVRIIRSMIGFGLNRSIHPKDLERIDVPGHGKGVLIGPGAHGIEFRENLLVHNFDRNILVRGGARDVTFTGNTIYNWGRGNVFVAGDSGNGGAASSGTFRNNIYFSGSNSFAGGPVFKPQNPETTAQFSLSGNIGPVAPGQPVPAPSEPAVEAFERVLKYAGPHAGLKDRLSLLACEQVTKRTGEVIDYLTEKRNPDARTALGFLPTLENLTTPESLAAYRRSPRLSR